jgi:hypothetical protein
MPGLEGLLAHGLRSVGLRGRTDDEKKLLSSLCDEAKKHDSVGTMCEFMNFAAVSKARRALAQHRLSALPEETVLKILRDLPEDKVNQDTGVLSVRGFVSASPPGDSLGRGTDVSLVKILSGSFSGAGVSTGGVSVPANIVEKDQDSPSASAKQWLVCAVDGDQFKVIELEVTVDSDELYIVVVSAKFSAGYAKKKWSGDFQTEANAVLADPKATESKIASSHSDAGYGIVDLTYSKPPQAPTKADVPKIIKAYPADDLQFLLDCIDRHSGDSQPARTAEPVKLVRPQVTPYVPEKSCLKVGDYMGVIIIEDAGDKRVNGKYIKTKRRKSDRSVYQHEASPQFKIQWSASSECWVLDDEQGVAPYKVMHDVHHHRRTDTNFPYDGVWQVHQQGALPVPLTRKTCFHYRSSCRMPKPEEQLRVFLQLPKSKTHPHLMLQTQQKWPAGGGWNPPNLAVTQRSLLLTTGTHLTQMHRAQSAGAIGLGALSPKRAQSGAATLLPSQVGKGATCKFATTM